MLGKCMIKFVLFNELLGKFKVIVSLVKEDAVGALRVDFYFDDG